MPSRHISKTQFKARALELFRHVEATGEPLIVTDHGKPTLEIRPYRKSVSNPMQALQNSVIRFDNPLQPVGEDDWQAMS